MLLGLASLAFGLWQQTRFLDCRHAHPNAKLAEAGAKELWVVVWIVTMGLFVPIAHYEELFRKNRQQPQSLLHQRARGAFWLGCFMTFLSVAFGLELIRRLVWSHWAWHEVLANMSVVFVLCWAGLVLTWKALGQHETSVLPFGEAEERQSQFRIEMNFATFLFAFPIAHWMSLPVGKALAAWGAFQSPQGFLANGTYVFPSAMTASYQAGLAGMFVFAANPLAMVMPLGVAAWRSERGGSLRVFATFGIGFSISFIFVFFSLIPTPPWRRRPCSKDSSWVWCLWRHSGCERCPCLRARA